MFRQFWRGLICLIFFFWGGGLPTYPFCASYHLRHQQNVSIHLCPHQQPSPQPRIFIHFPLSLSYSTVLLIVVLGFPLFFCLQMSKKGLTKVKIIVVVLFLGYGLWSMTFDSMISCSIIVLVLFVWFFYPAISYWEFVLFWNTSIFFFVPFIHLPCFTSVHYHWSD